VNACLEIEKARYEGRLTVEVEVDPALRSVMIPTFTLQPLKVNGFQLLSMIDEEIMPKVVFVTAYDAYAIQAFEKNAFDYLLKPVQKDRLASTIEKLEISLRQGQRPVYRSPPFERIPCTGSNSIRLIDLSEVEYVQCSAAGVYVVTAKGEFFTELTLQVLEAKTDLIGIYRRAPGAARPGSFARTAWLPVSTAGRCSCIGGVRITS
jgi:DNA-binding LytR/AlgR family response regulator